MLRLNLTLILSLTVGACGGSDDSSSQSETPTPGPTTFDVTWAPETTVIDDKNMDLVRSADRESHTYTIDTAAAQSRALDLTPGRILVIHGTALRRITGVTPDGVVSTDFASLEEAMSDADISWDQTVDFTPDRAAQTELVLDGKRLQAARPADGDVEWSTKIGQYAYKVTMTMKGDTTDVVLQIEKDIGGGVKGRFTATGQLQKFVSHNSIKIADHQLQQFGHTDDNLKGTMKLNLTVAGSGNDALDFKVPVVLVKYPALVGPIPVVLGISAQFVLKGVVPVEGSSQVEANFAFDGTAGFQFNGATFENKSSINLPKLDKGNVTQTGAAGAIGANFGVGFPRMSLGIFGETAVGWIQPAYLIGGSYTFMPACQTADALFQVSTGYDVKILTVKIASGNQKLFEKTKPLLRAGNCPAGTSARFSHSIGP